MKSYIFQLSFLFHKRSERFVWKQLILCTFGLFTNILHFLCWWKILCSFSTPHLDLNLKKEQFHHRSGAIYKWISSMPGCFIKVFVLTQIEHSWMILSIFQTSLLDSVFHFHTYRNLKFPCSQVQQVLLIGPFFGATRLLLAYWLEQNDTGESLCSFKDKGDPAEVTKLYTATFHRCTK